MAIILYSFYENSIADSTCDYEFNGFIGAAVAGGIATVCILYQQDVFDSKFGFFYEIFKKKKQE